MQQRTIRNLSAALFVGLLVWGIYSLLFYVGMPVHQATLNPDGQNSVAAACGDSVLCGGLVGFFPFVFATITRAAPFLGYLIVCIVLYGIFLGWQAARHGELTLQLRWRPAYLPILFAVLVWILFTCFSFGSTDGTSPFRQIVEPTTQAYGNIGAAPLKSLQDNFQDLKTRGCLTSLGSSDSGLNVYQLKESCIQQSFFTRVLGQMLFIALFLFELLVLGGFLLRLFRVQSRGFLMESVVSLGLGACGMVVIFWTLALLSLYSAPFGWTLLILLPLVLFRQSWYWLKALWKPKEIEVSWKSATILLGWLLLSYLALNFLTVVRPFPIGWDDLGSYLNRPRLLVSYGHFVPLMPSFQWEYLTSLGFLLFGYDSVFGATASMMINWSAGLLALLSVFLFARTFLGDRRGFLAALLYYTLPLVGHFSYADMKIDNAVFTMGALAMFCAFLFLFPHDSGDEAGRMIFAPLTSGWRATISKNWQWLALGGIFVGFGFGFKSTSVMTLMALLIVIAGTAQWLGVFAGLFLVLFIFQRFGLLASVASRVGGDGAQAMLPMLGLLFLIIAVIFTVFFFIRVRRNAVTIAGSIAIFLIAFALAIAPWITHNNLSQGLSPFHLTLGMQDNLVPVIDIAGTAQSFPGKTIKTLPKDLALDPNNAACKSTGGTEELDRYWGFAKGWGHYLTLPWRTVMNIDSAGYYVTTMPALLLFPLIFLLPAFWTKKERWLRWIFAGTMLYIAEWMFLANGVPWYGVGMFLGLAIGLEALLVFAPDSLNSYAIIFLLSCSLLSNFAMRFWQFEQQRNLLEYPLGKISADALRIRTIPYYDDIRTIVVQRHESMPDRPYLYRIGTFIPYFIPKNSEIIGTSDQQLDLFNCLNQENNPALTLKRLKALGFNSIIFDTNTATIEQDPNGTLHKKAQAFVNFLNSPSLNLQILVSDPAAGLAFILIP